MTTSFDINILIRRGLIANELDYERALIADRKLRLLVKEDPSLKIQRSKLRDLIEAYELQNWSSAEQVSDEQMLESDQAESRAEKERHFIETRKQAIRKKLKELKITQKDLSSLLGHKSETHMSELMNGLKPFTLRDLILINRLLSIEMDKLILTAISEEERSQIKNGIRRLNRPNLKLTKEGLKLT